MEAGGRFAPRHVDERPHVLLRRRRVHHDAAAAVGAAHAQVAAEAGIGRGGRQRGQVQSLGQRQRGGPAPEGRFTRRVGPGDGGGGRDGRPVGGGLGGQVGRQGRG